MATLKLIGGKGLGEADYFDYEKSIETLAKRQKAEKDITDTTLFKSTPALVAQIHHLSESVVYADIRTMREHWYNNRSGMYRSFLSMKARGYTTVRYAYKNRPIDEAIALAWAKLAPYAAGLDVDAATGHLAG